jgi:hypothetical protein
VGKALVENRAVNAALSAAPPMQALFHSLPGGLVRVITVERVSPQGVSTSFPRWELHGQRDDNRTATIALKNNKSRIKMIDDVSAVLDE